MKLRHLLFGALVGVAFAACTSNDDPAGVSPVKGADEVAAANSYMKVSFVMPGNAATRADAEGDAFEYGTDAENAVTSGTLFFFDGTTQVAEPFDLSGLTWNGETTPTIEKVSDIVVVLENPLREPTSVVAVLNATLTELGLSRSSTLDDIKAVLLDFATGKTTSGTFVMSSSAYDGAENNVAAKITATYPTYDAAKAAASVKVPVERVVAKVQVDGSKPTLNLANADEASNVITIDGAEMTLTATVDGFWFDNAADKSLLLKDISDNAADDNDATNMRSYWAKSAATAWAHGTLSDATAADKYVQENTNADNPTQVVVAVTLKDDSGNALKLVKEKGKLYTEAGFATAAINIEAQTYWTMTESTVIDEESGEEVTKKTYTTVSANDLKVVYNKTAPAGVTLESYQAYATVEPQDASTVFYVQDATAEDGYAEAKNPTFGAYVVQRWDDGKAYYAVPIQHDADRQGVVRNHVYKLTVKSINGLGTPIPFKDVDEIIPTIPVETETYISAEIDILRHLGL